MIEQIEGNPKEKKIVQRNSQQLLNLVNRMLDLSKVKSKKLKFHMLQGDMVSYINYVTEPFHSLAYQKKIKLGCISEQQALIMDYDPERMLQILFNLITNALKFTAEYGEVQVLVKQAKRNSVSAYY